MTRAGELPPISIWKTVVAFGRRRQPPPAAPILAPVQDDIATSVDLAWRAHTAQERWTAKVDIKASVLLALEGGAIFATLTANGNMGLLSRLIGLGDLAQLLGIILLIGAVTTATWALIPQLGSAAEHRATHRDHTIYFGHLRHWDPAELAARLRTAGQEDPFPMLARQLVEMSKRNWTKHRKVQASLLLGVGGVALIAMAAIMAAIA